jgi:uncharacterized protein involved in exopolysaccharide biosynthesis
MSQRNLVVIDRSGGGSVLVKDLTDRLFRQKYLILVLFVLLTLGTASYLYLLPTSFQSEMAFLVNNIRADALVTPESGNGQITRNYVDEAAIATEIQLLSSRELFRTAVIKCNLAEDQSAASVEKAIKDLRKELKISPVLKANMIKATYSSSNPQEAAAVLKTMADGYLSEHLRVHSTSGVYEFFNKQTLLYEQRLKDAQNRLADFQGQKNIVLLGQQKDLNLRKMVDLEASLKETQAARLENEQRLRTLKGQLANLNPRITTQARKMPNQYSVERMNTLLVELQNRRTELLTKFRPEDRMIKQIDQQIADTKVAIEGANSLNAVEESTDVNPLRASLEAELAKGESNSTGLRARSAILAKQLTEYQQSLGTLRHNTADDDQLLREIKETEDNFFLYSKKREEARIAEAMDRQKISNVVLVEEPQPSPIPKPKLSTTIVASYLLGCALILGIAFCFSITRNTVYTPWELEAFTGLPVLATVPHERLPHSILDLERLPAPELIP